MAGGIRVRRWLPIALVVCLAVAGWQSFRWWRTGNYWARQYAGGMVNRVIGIERLQATTDLEARSLEMAWVYGASGRGSPSLGEVLDVMVQNGYPLRVGILGRVELELSWFSRDLWAQRGLTPPVYGSRQNALLPPADLDRLAQVWRIYRDCFSEAVVHSGSYERQRQALLEAHRRLEEQGLTKLLERPELLGQGL